MADQNHLAALRADVDEWNRWRAENPGVIPDLAGADLHRASLVMADLRQAVLRGADLSLANLMGADLREADLRGANLVGARLIGADLRAADLRGADLRTAEDLTREQLEETAGDEKTLLPDERQRPLAWSSELDAR
ncbi:MAG TPA: pentapeptide repeat-containing protein [Bryobacteraceae bacterium]|nr:pentapeptide repeat-containing protein [Bryobacteraceae bacterium]